MSRHALEQNIYSVFAYRLKIKLKKFPLLFGKKFLVSVAFKSNPQKRRRRLLEVIVTFK